MIVEWRMRGAHTRARLISIFNLPWPPGKIVGEEDRGMWWAVAVFASSGANYFGISPFSVLWQFPQSKIFLLDFALNEIEEIRKSSLRLALVSGGGLLVI